MGAKISRELQRSEHTEQHFEEDYDHRVVRKLIRTGRLAPCFNGLSELPATTDESSRITVHKYPFLPWDLPNLRSTAAGALLQADSGQVVECPICLLYYPIHINYSRCCNQPICTECFLQMKRSTKTPLRPASCPFCVKPDFGVIYVPPPFSSQHKHVAKQRQKSLLDGRGSSGRRKNYAWDDPNVVLVGTCCCFYYYKRRKEVYWD
ncbi:hypothetical protein BDB00DRAFT_109211 [Zychaea mexicana]|uniref:uncharacterized protein n=1 Tax=Zychaea mexicana TaxID=64656 RepID=UPI0022FEA844|nr:uncharacterized protein BDB00DRAFT_109211 [Zychaea mexicana]KAI9484876.1 hypothetical protein BDB00DRAFT_109211 [Zychaea mexicana]